MEQHNYYFLDTSAVLSPNLDWRLPFAISSITLLELEILKHTYPKVEKILKKIGGKHDLTIHIYKTYMDAEVESLDLFVEDYETKILATAIDYDKTAHPDETIFVTNNSYLQTISNLYFGEDSIINLK